MENEEINKIINAFSLSIKPIEYSKNKYLLTTPFFNNSGNPFTVAVIIYSPDDFVLTDMKNTINLEEAKNNAVIQSKISAILNKYNIKNIDGELCIKFKFDELLYAYDYFIHALILVDNLLN